MKSHPRQLQAVVALALAVLAGGGAQAQTAASSTQAATSTPAPSGKAAANASKHVNDAATVVNRMAAEPGMSNVLKQAKGVFIVPTYGRAALGVGVSGGAGVMLARRDDGSWSDPAFYNTGGLSIGAQAGAEGGPVALVLMNDKAVNSFRQKNKFSLSADAGLTVVNWAKTAQGTAGLGDVVAWAGTKGLFGNVVTISVRDVRFNQRASNAYYGKTVTASEILEGKAMSDSSTPLKQALATAAGGSAK